MVENKFNELKAEAGDIVCYRSSFGTVYYYLVEGYELEEGAPVRNYTVIAMFNGVRHSGVFMSADNYTVVAWTQQYKLVISGKIHNILFTILLWI